MSDPIIPEGGGTVDPGQPRNDLGQFETPAPSQDPYGGVPVDEAVRFYQAFHNPQTREQAVERTLRQYGYLPEGLPVSQAQEVLNAYAQEAGNPLYQGQPQHQQVPQGAQFMGYDQFGQPVYQPGVVPQQQSWTEQLGPDDLRNGWQYDFQQGLQQARQDIRNEVLGEIRMEQAQGAVNSVVQDIAQRDGLDDQQRGFLTQIAGQVMRDSQEPLTADNARRAVQQTYDMMRGFRQQAVAEQVAQHMQTVPQTTTQAGYPSGQPQSQARGIQAAVADAQAKIEAERAAGLL